MQVAERAIKKALDRLEKAGGGGRGKRLVMAPRMPELLPEDIPRPVCKQELFEVGEWDEEQVRGSGGWGWG